MVFYFIYKLPLWLHFLVTVSIFVSFSVIGYLLTARLIRTYFHKDTEGVNDIVSYFMATLGSVFGIILGLVAVGVWTNFAEAQELVDEEAAVTYALYQQCSHLPGPIVGQIKNEIRGYIDDVIKKEWSQAQEGVTPDLAAGRIRKIEQLLYAVDPVTEKDRIILAQAIERFNELSIKRRDRIFTSQGGLPGLVWSITRLGCILIVVTSWFYHTNRRIHIAMSVIVGILLGSIVFMIAAMDQPYKGRFAISPDSFIEVLSRLVT